ncbi:MAG: glycoside hydrolase family 5 protein [Sphingomonadaceae bacterium]
MNRWMPALRAVLTGWLLWAGGVAAAAPLPMLHVDGPRWVDASGHPVALRGVNLGNWLMQEFWMMGQGSAGIDDQCKLEQVLDQRFGYAQRERLFALFRAQWMQRRDWDLLPRFGLNLVRLPFIYSLIEDERHPGQLRADAWHYLDRAIAEAEQRGLYVILDLHGAPGSQGWEHHSGCAGKNQYWSTPAYQARTEWLWQQIASRYKERGAVAGYSILNEPWGTTPEQLASAMQRLYGAIRAVDAQHVIILPGHVEGIAAYGKPAEHGMHNVALEMHFYPGHFGWGQPGAQVHADWLQCAGGKGLCDWQARLAPLQTAFFVGEFQPWAQMGAELGGQVTRATYDAYAAAGWASAAWSYKIISNDGGQGAGTWGLVTNARDARVPAVDFNTATLAQIERLFRRFGSVPYEPQQAVMRWMRAATPPAPFAGLPAVSSSPTTSP